MMYRCIECGQVFDEPDTWKEDRGEFWGVSCSETMSGCPECQGDYEEVFECEECGEWFFEDELEDGLCEKCAEERLEFKEKWLELGKQLLDGFLEGIGLGGLNNEQRKAN